MILPAQSDFNTVSTLGEPKHGKKPVGWIRIGVDRLQLGLGSIEVFFFFRRLSLARLSTQSNSSKFLLRRILFPPKVLLHLFSTDIN